LDPEVTLTGACHWWADAAHTARWQDRDVVVWLGPELPPDDPLGARLRERAGRWIGRSDAPLWPLLAVSAVDGRPAWIYPAATVASAAALARVAPEGWPPRAALGLCARVADALVALGSDGAQHPGPEAHHVLLTPDGGVLLSHLAGPGPRSPARREPRGREDEGATVWRVGVLLAELLTGHPPQPATDPSSHEASTRRLSIRLLARSGPPLPDEVRSWVLAMLAWETRDRPPLVLLGDRLAALAARLDGPDLAAFAADRVPVARQAATHPAVPVAPAPEELPEDRPDRTEEVVDPDPTDGDLDEETVSVETDAPPPRSLPPEQGAIPVGVGPPAELLLRMRKVPGARLWSDLTASITRPPPAGPAAYRFAPLLAGSIVGMALVGALTAWLFWR
jgi:hypothetical protein